ncbi:MAG: hypothetical protein Q8K63_11090 [Acidimicrobiales bacterium]|nr:hypothetical protein [Acidimicrobiales bacterium]
MRERQELLDALPGEYHALRDPGSLPVLLIEDERAQRGEANPGVVLFDEEADPPADEADGHRRLLDRFASSYRDLTVRHHPAPITLRGADATVSSWEYTHEWDGMGIRRTVRTILVFRERHAHTFHLGDNTESPWVEDDVWNELLGSVRYG